MHMYINSQLNCVFGNRIGGKYKVWPREASALVLACEEEKEWDISSLFVRPRYQKK